MKVKSARLSPADAVNYLESSAASSTDWLSFWVFDNRAEGSPSAAEVVTHLTERDQLLSVLRRRIADVPGGIGNPTWVSDPSPMRSRIESVESPIDWADLLVTMTETFGVPLDARECTWRLKVYPEVLGAPGSDGSVTVVTGQVSHALLVGAQFGDLSSALFGEGHEELRVPGLGPELRRPRLAASAAVSAVRLPLEWARWRWALRRYIRRSDIERARPDVLEPRTTTAFNVRTEAIPAVAVVRVVAVRGRGVTTTAFGLTAISHAMQRYLETVGADCPDDLAATVIVSVGQHVPSMGVNRVCAIPAPLNPAEPDLAARARAIQTGLRTASTARLSPPGIEELKVVAALPFVMVVRSRRRNGADASATVTSTVVTSVRHTSGSGWALCGRPYQFGGALINTKGTVGLMHTIVGDEEGVTVTVIADRFAVRDVDRYGTLLSDAFDEVAAQLS